MKEFTDPWQEEGLVAFQHPNVIPYLSDRRLPNVSKMQSLFAYTDYQPVYFS